MVCTTAGCPATTKLTVRSAATIYLALIALMASPLTRDPPQPGKGSNPSSKPHLVTKHQEKKLSQDPPPASNPAKREFSVMADGQLHLGA